MTSLVVGSIAIDTVETPFGRADEALGGYDIFKEAKIRRFWGSNLDSQWRPLLLKRLYPYLQEFRRQSSSTLRHFFRATSSDLASPFFSHLLRWELTSKLKLLFSNDFRDAAALHGAEGPAGARQAHASDGELRRSLPDAGERGAGCEAGVRGGSASSGS